MNLESGVLQVHIEDIIPNRFQPRLNFDEQGLNWQIPLRNTG